MDIIERIEKNQIAKLSSGKEMPNFNPGDTVKVDVKVVEGTRERIQAFEGVCIARSGTGINESLQLEKYHMAKVLKEYFLYFLLKFLQ